MRAVIDTRRGISLTFTPQTLEQEIIQNVYCILATVKGSVPCYRDFGMDNDFLHKPSQTAMASYAAAAADAIAKYEPRASISNISFDVDSNNPGHLQPVLEVVFVE